MKPEISIRIAVPEDTEKISFLGKETFHDAFVGNPLMPQDDLFAYLDTAFTLEQIIKEMSDEKTIFLLAEVKGDLAGYAKLEREASAFGVTAKNPVKLKRLYSKQKFIGCGVGKILMQRCLKEALRFDCDVIWLSVWKDNLQAQDFYRKWNFEETGSYDFQLGKTLFVDKLMQRPVVL